MEENNTFDNQSAQPIAQNSNTLSIQEGVLEPTPQNIQSVTENAADLKLFVKHSEIKDILKKELIDNTEELKKEIKKESEDTKKEFLTFFGLFASFLTFIGIEVQIFKNNDNIYELIGVSSISISFIILFVLLINAIIKEKTSLKDFLKPMYLLVLIFVSIGSFLLYCGDSIDTKTSKRINYLENQLKNDSISLYQLKKELKKSKAKENIDQSKPSP